MLKPNKHGLYDHAIAITVKTDYGRFANGEDPAVAKLAKRHHMLHDGGGFGGGRWYDSVYLGGPKGARNFAAAAKAAGYQVYGNVPAEN
jgi:hypothetical protein